jgi:heme exporter protein D
VSYLPYVIGAYAVFVAAFLWDFLAPRLQVRRERKPAGSDRAAELSR